MNTDKSYTEFDILLSAQFLIMYANNIKTLAELLSVTKEIKLDKLEEAGMYRVVKDVEGEGTEMRKNVYAQFKIVDEPWMCVRVAPSSFLRKWHN
ncbi:hypothetical protein J2S74_000908 [Evansella vedderi]|uniref:Uncharacterized protein n=1 Tax=Evansella vedderi TaxID=38282 RepID=A0ABT9ZQL7_9BACI|nr:hypothetical protein [Evansella vedderi]MDQ0253536.1 hypothetical protein [Evansella vedderi]